MLPHVDDPDKAGKNKGKKKATTTTKKTPTPSPKSSQNNSPDITGDDGDQPSPVSPPSSPKFPEDFKSIADEEIAENCWKLIVNTLDHIKSNKLRFILTHWMVFGSTVLVKDMQLTGMHKTHSRAKRAHTQHNHHHCDTYTKHTHMKHITHKVKAHIWRAGLGYLFVILR